MRRLVPLLLPLALLAAGCAQTESSSIIAADGSVQRRVSVTIDNSSNPMAAEGEAIKPASIIAFEGAAGWSVEEKTGEKGQDIVVGARSLKPGESLTREFTLTDNRDGRAECLAKAVKHEDGTIVYTETWTWVGKVDDSQTPLARLQAVVDEKLAPWGVSEAERKAILEGVRRKAWRALFGPGDPMLSQLLTNPNQAVRRLNNVMALAFLEEMKDIPGKTEAEKLAVIKEMVAGMDAAGSAAEPPVDEESGKPDLMVSILSRAKGPGDLLDHNGDYDVLEGEVFWSMYLEACMIEPVVLQAVYRP